LNHSIIALSVYIPQVHIWLSFEGNEEGNLEIIYDIEKITIKKNKFTLQNEGKFHYIFEPEQYVPFDHYLIRQLLYLKSDLNFLHKKE